MNNKNEGLRKNLVNNKGLYEDAALKIFFSITIGVLIFALFFNTTGQSLSLAIVNSAIIMFLMALLWIHDAYIMLGVMFIYGLFLRKSGIHDLEEFTKVFQKSQFKLALISVSIPLPIFISLFKVKFENAGVLALSFMYIVCYLLSMVIFPRLIKKSLKMK